MIEQFFELRVVSPPYRPNSMCGFTRMLNVPPQVLKDFIQIMRFELMPDLTQGLKWNVQFCLRVPSSATPIVPVGMPAVLICKMKILFFVSLFQEIYCATTINPIYYFAVTNYKNSIFAWYGMERLCVIGSSNGL